MASPLQGAELRVFASLASEWTHDTVEEIRAELTRGVELSSEEIEVALESLCAKGYLKEFEPGHWELAPNGHGVKRSLLGELVADADAA